MNSMLMIAAAVVSLNGEWQLQGWPTPDRGSVRSLEEVPAETISVPAKVPGCYELDLCAAGMLPDLFYANNQYAVRKYEGHQWLYSRKFTLGKVEQDQKAFLEFDGLDTLCDVFVNGRKVGEAADMFIPHEFDVTRFVREGENELAVLFRAPIVESQFVDIAPIGDANSSAELEGFRKPAHMIGWDILPRFVSAGIFRDARLVVRKAERIRDWFCAQTAIDPEKRSANYLLDLRLEGSFKRIDTSEIVVTVSRNGKVVASPRTKVVHWAPRLGFGLRNADLWWPRGFGEPALYDVAVQWRDIATQAVYAEKNFKLGVRKIEFTLADYEIATKKPGEMLFTVNGKPCFIRGTSWVPVDALHCRDKDRIIPTLELIAEANCNMIRVWGGGLYEPEMFWNWCDENGVMVWQDFMMACTVPPQDDAFAAKMAEEVLHQVLRLRNHASLVLWAGDNENDQAGAWTLDPKHRDPNTNRITRRVIPDILKEHDVTRPYLPSSPYISTDAFAKRSRPSEDHLWGGPRGWWKTDYYAKTPYWFCSEGGAHAIPCRESLERMMGKADAERPWTNPDAATWRDLNWNDMWHLHATCPFLDRKIDPFQRNNIVTRQCAALFGEVPRHDLDLLVAESQTAQAESIKFQVELFRSEKLTRRGGYIVWNLRDGWPTVSDAICDYYGAKKKSFHALKTAYQDVLLMVTDGGKLRAINDLLKPVKGTVKVVEAKDGATVFEGPFEVAANAFADVVDLKWNGQGMYRIEWSSNACSGRNNYLHGKPPFRWADYKEWTKGL